jgi:hypothetical protein
MNLSITLISKRSNLLWRYSRPVLLCKFTLALFEYTKSGEQIKNITIINIINYYIIILILYYNINNNIIKEDNNNNDKI